jgi:hypothetical protein
MARGAQAPPNQLWFYQSKDGKMEKTFDALEWLAAMTLHVPNRPGWLRWFQYLLKICCFQPPPKKKQEYDKGYQNKV